MKAGKYRKGKSPAFNASGRLAVSCRVTGEKQASRGGTTTSAYDPGCVKTHLDEVLENCILCCGLSGQRCCECPAFCISKIEMQILLSKTTFEFSYNLDRLGSCSQIAKALLLSPSAVSACAY